MAGTRFPAIPTHEVATHDSEKSCYVIVGANVYDVTSFLCDHPGGGHLILKYGGKDVSEIMRDGLSHVHSKAAYEILHERLIGFVANEATVKFVREHDPPEDLTKETDYQADIIVHRFLDLDKPLLAQVWNGNFSKDFYFEQVHRPRYYSKGESAPLFGNFLEPLSTTAWYVVPLAWLPPAIWGTFLANQGMPSMIRTAQYVLFGLVLWPLVEYGVHRAVHHMHLHIPDNRIGITLHFVLHGLHHYLPMDKYRLATSPLVFVFLAAPFYRLAHLLFYRDWHAATAIFCGGLFGYVYYELVHYHLHHKAIPFYWRNLKKHHLQHHYADYENGFGVTTQFWDRVFGTEFRPRWAANAAGVK